MQFKKIFLASVCTLSLVGCNSDIKDAIRENLKDPDSAKFEEIIRVGSRACVRYNAKNSYGGYTGVVTANLEQLSSKQWYVEPQSEEDQECTQTSLQEKLAVDVANIKSEAEVVKLLKEKKLVSSDASKATLIH